MKDYWSYVLRSLTVAAIIGLAAATWGSSFAISTVSAKVDSLTSTMQDLKIDIREIRKER